MTMYPIKINVKNEIHVETTNDDAGNGGKTR